VLKNQMRFAATTSKANIPMNSILFKHYKSLFPAHSVQRCNKPVATDTVYSV